MDEKRQNREFRFRVWDTFNNRMVYDPDRFEPSYSDDEKTEAPFTYYETWQDREDGIKRPCYVMQYTGLKDKNGKEIYESDICIKYWSKEVFGDREPVKGFVKWVSFGGRYTFEWRDSVGNLRYEELHENLKYPEYPRSLFEIIGNIYENPELSES